MSGTSSRASEGLARSASKKLALSTFRWGDVEAGRRWSTRSRTGSFSGTSSGRGEGASRSRSRRSSGFATTRSLGLSGSSRRIVGSSSRRTAARLVNGAVEEVEKAMILERLVKAERFGLKMKVKASEDDKFEFKSESGFKKQFEFNLKLRDRFVGDLKSELESCFGKIPEKISSLMTEVEKVIEDRNLKLKIGEEFGIAAMEEFSEENLARNEGERKKLEVFRKEKEAKEFKMGIGAKSRGFRRGAERT